MVIAVATGVTYGIVYDNARARDLQHLATYVKERARREAIGFRQIEANMLLVRGQFLKRMEAGRPRDIEQKWRDRFEVFADGSWRSKTNFWDGRRYATLWAHRACQLNPDLQTQVLRAQDICDELLPGWVDTFPSVYFVLPGGPAWLNIGFDPRIANWVWDTPADYDATPLEWFHLALPPERPRDAFAWTGIIEEPTTKVPIVSVYLPIFRDGQFLGSIGHDEYVNRMMDEITQSDLPGARHVIFRSDGRIVAHPTKLKEILATKGQLLMQNCGEPELASLYRVVAGRAERDFSGFDPASGDYYSAAWLSGPGWHFLTTMPRELLQRQAFQSAQWVLWSGLVSLGLMLGLLAVTLRRQIAGPLAELLRATKQMSAGDVGARAAVARDDELGLLGRAFNEMAARVSKRDAELRAEKASLEQRVAERTAELARFASIAEATGDFFGFADMAEQILYINPAGRRLLGLAPEAPLDGLRIRDVHAAAAYQQLHEVAIPAGLRNGACAGESELRHRDGRVIPVSLMLVIPRTSQGEPMFISAIMHDITAERAAEAELRKTLERERELSELKSNFVSLVSHEFRTPLEIIMSSVDNLDRYHERLPQEKRQQLLHSIHRAVRRMAGMMEEVLVLGRLETDRVTFRPVPLDLATVCRRICDEIESATNRRCPIELTVREFTGEAVGDEGLLRHILTNLLSNAVKYSAAGEPVALVIERENDLAVCRVEDRGCGIPEGDQKRLFQAFHRGSNVENIPGTGLGLLIVQRCVELHGGAIRFRSVEGQGTTFTVTLPLFGGSGKLDPSL